MANTFYALLPLADWQASPPAKLEPKSPPASKENPAPQAMVAKPLPTEAPVVAPGLHYNIQIHLPATKDVEVFNAIFKSLKEHLVA